MIIEARFKLRNDFSVCLEGYAPFSACDAPTERWYDTLEAGSKSKRQTDASESSLKAGSKPRSTGIDERRERWDFYGAVSCESRPRASWA